MVITENNQTTDPTNPTNTESTPSDQGQSPNQEDKNLEINFEDITKPVSQDEVAETPIETPIKTPEETVEETTLPVEKEETEKVSDSDLSLDFSDVPTKEEPTIEKSESITHPEEEVEQPQPSVETPKEKVVETPEEKSEETKAENTNEDLSLDLDMTIPEEKVEEPKEKDVKFPEQREEVKEEINIPTPTQGEDSEPKNEEKKIEGNTEDISKEDTKEIEEETQEEKVEEPKIDEGNKKIPQDGKEEPKEEDQEISLDLETSNEENTEEKTNDTNKSTSLDLDAIDIPEEKKESTVEQDNIEQKLEEGNKEENKDTEEKVKEPKEDISPSIDLDTDTLEEEKTVETEEVNNNKGDKKQPESSDENTQEEVSQDVPKETEEATEDKSEEKTSDINFDLSSEELEHTNDDKSWLDDKEAQDNIEITSEKETKDMETTEDKNMQKEEIAPESEPKTGGFDLDSLTLNNDQPEQNTQTMNESIEPPVTPETTTAVQPEIPVQAMEQQTNTEINASVEVQQPVMPQMNNAMNTPVETTNVQAPEMSVQQNIPMPNSYDVYGNKQPYMDPQQVNNVPVNMEQPVSNNGGGMDLDSMISGVPNITPPVNNKNETLPDQTIYHPTPKKKSKPLLAVILLIVILGVAGYLFKTMFPMEFDNLVGKFTNKETVEQVQNNEDIVPTTGAIMTGTNEEKLITTGATQETQPEENKIGEEVMTGMQEVSTGHQTAGDEVDVFGQLDEMMEDETAQQQEYLSQLRKYSEEGKEYWELGQTIQHKVLVKYGLYVYKKADGFIESIENGEEIDTQELDKHFAQFSSYLDKLEALVGDEGITQTNPKEVENSTPPPTKITEEEPAQEETPTIGEDIINYGNNEQTTTGTTMTGTTESELF